MSNFSTLESSTEGSVPIELYVVEIGIETPVRWTSGNKVISAPTAIPNDYIPERGLSRTSISVGEEERQRVMSISVSGANKVARRYIGTPPGRQATITIYRVQNDDPDLVLNQIYQGSILSAQFNDDGQSAVIACQSIEAASSQTIPRYTYGSMCQHVLYGPGCDVDPGLGFTLTSSVTSISGTTVTVSGAGAFAHSFVGGYIKPTGAQDFRMVIAQAGDVLTVLLPFEVDPTGATVEALAGCDHIIDGSCAETFDNIAEYSGYAFVPTRNPFESGI
jgi:hypothetical protein